MHVLKPIDAVYLWVDGDDSYHQQQRAYWEASEQNVHVDCRSPSRFADHGELKYSLRSLAMHAPWVRNVYIITAGQCPVWLDRTHPKLHLVHHRDILHLPLKCTTQESEETNTSRLFSVIISYGVL